jgi:hypothetical protein
LGRPIGLLGEGLATITIGLPIVALRLIIPPPSILLLCIIAISVVFLKNYEIN